MFALWSPLECSWWSHTQATAVNFLLNSRIMLNHQINIKGGKATRTELAVGAL